MPSRSSIVAARTTELTARLERTPQATPAEVRSSRLSPPEPTSLSEKTHFLLRDARANGLAAGNFEQVISHQRIKHCDRHILFHS